MPPTPSPRSYEVQVHCEQWRFQIVRLEGAYCWTPAAKTFSPHTSVVNTASRPWIFRKRSIWHLTKGHRRRSAEEMLVPVPTAQSLIQSLFWLGLKVSSAVLFADSA